MKKKALQYAGGGLGIAGLMFSLVSWTSGELKEKASKNELAQVENQVERMDNKLDRILWHLVSMKHAMDSGHAKIATEEMGAIPN